MNTTNLSVVVDVGDDFGSIAPKSKEHLAIYCANIFNVIFPYPSSDEEYCVKNNHKSPLDAMWAAYAELDDFSIWYAMRGTGKTFDLALLSFLESTFKPQCGINVLGGSLEQSTKAISYLKDLWEYPNVPRHLLCGNEVAGRGYKLTNGSWVTALAASTKSVRGPHPQKLRLDECLGEDTLIHTLRGLIKIKDIIPNDIVYGWNGYDIINGVVQYNKYVGEKQTYKVKLSNNKIIYCTINHKILTTKGYLYLYEIIRRKYKGERIIVIGECKGLFKVWNKIKRKTQIYNWILSKLLFRKK